MPVTAGVGVEERLQARVAAGHKLLVPYLTGGVTPNWVDYLRSYAEAGADAIEIGLPFSDPILDGPVIQEASDQALRNGTTVAGLLKQLAEVDLPVPLIAFTYYNLVVHTGPKAFCTALASAGVRGLIVPDLPVDEVDELARAAQQAGVDLSLLAAPSTTADRQAWIVQRSRGFVYAVTVMGTTGVRGELAESGLELAGRLKQQTDLPVLLGFGISEPGQAVAAAQVADGVAVGSELMRLILNGEPPAVLGERVAQMRMALDRSALDRVALDTAFG
jgi:tryptophan synthase alpha chain